MMIIASAFALSVRGGDALGTWIYGLSPTHGFQHCVLVITLCYALILPLIFLLPRHLTTSPDGQPNAEEDSLVRQELTSP